MSGKRLQLKRGTTAQTSTFTGLNGEVTVDTTKKTLVVHDGSTVGGTVLAKDSDVALKVDKVAGKQLSTEDYSTDEKSKLAGISASANNYTHPTSGVGAGTYKSVTVDVNGHVTDGTNPTTVSGYGLTDVYTKIQSNLSLALKVNNAEKGVANGVATLDVNGKVVLAQIPDSVLGQLEYMGTWDFTTVPTATQKCQYWIASVSGNGYIVGDWAVWNGATFDKVDNTDAVATVAGRTGNVVLTKSDVLLDNADNTSDSDKPVSTAQQTALNLKANLASPTFTGTVTAPTFSGALSGNATSATTATSASAADYATKAGSADNINGISFKNANVTSSFVVDTQATNGIGYSSGYSLFGQSDGAVYAGVYDANYQHQIVGDFRTGKIAVRGKNNGTWQPWKEVAYTDSNITGNAGTATNGTPAGTIITFASATAPTGYLKANGVLISRTVYADLFAAIGTTFGAGDGSTTFALPDLRGYFQRGWDDGGGIDIGRIFGSLQQDSYLNHSHTANSVSAGEHTHASTGVPSAGWRATSSAVGTDNAKGTVNNTINATIGSGGAHTHTITVYSSTTGSGETRPKNIALLYCIKY